jgi:DNA polymerase iota
MHADLVEEDDDVNDQHTGSETSQPMKRWLAHPKTIRLSTRPRPPQNPDGSRNRSFARISKSASMPTFVFSFKEDMGTIVDKLIHETLLPLFRKLHPEKRGWNLSLVNVAATNMADAASEKGGVGRDIGKMFKRQDEVLRQWRVEEEEPAQNQAEQGEWAMEQPVMFEQRVLMMEEPDQTQEDEYMAEEPWLKERKRELAQGQQVLERHGSEDIPTSSQGVESLVTDVWESEDEDVVDDDSFRCEACGAKMPTFAMGAHYRWHAQM